MTRLALPPDACVIERPAKERLFCVEKDLARFLRRCNVETVKGLSVRGDRVVHLAPAWAVQAFTQCVRRDRHRSAIARALRRAVRDDDFRQALEAAVVVGLGPEFVTTQMGSPPLE